MNDTKNFLKAQLICIAGFVFLSFVCWIVIVVNPNSTETTAMFLDELFWGHAMGSFLIFALLLSTVITLIVYVLQYINQ